MARFGKRELVYYGEGIGGFTTVTKSADALGNMIFSLANSGKTDASSRGDMATQTLLAHFPMLFQKNPRAVMVIGLASGVTAGEVLCYPVEKLDVLEINDQVAAASKFFEPWNSHVLSDSRTHLIIQDARAHLQLTAQKYDVIISEPSNPWMAGLAALFSREFFALVNDRLTDEGIFVQWMHAYQMDWETIAMVGRTFAEVFPNSLLLNTAPSGGGNDYLLVGFKGQNGLNLKYADQKRADVQKSKNVVLKDPRLLYRLLVSQNLPKLFGPGQIHTDNRPRLEFTAPKLMYSSDQLFPIYQRLRSPKWTTLTPDTTNVIRQAAKNADSQIDFAAYALSLHSPFSGMLDLTQATANQKKRFFELFENHCAQYEVDCSIFTDNQLTQRCLAIQIDVIVKNMDRLPDLPLSYGYLGTLYSRQGRPAEAIVAYEKALQMNPFSAALHNNLGVALSEQGRVDDAIRHYKESLRIDPEYRQARYSLGFVLAKQGRKEEAIVHYTAGLETDSDPAQEHYRLGLIMVEQNWLAEAIDHFSEALRLNPSHAEAYNALGAALSKLDRLDEATLNYTKALQINPRYVEAQYNLGLVQAKQGRLDEAVSHFSMTLRIDPEYRQAYNELAVALSKQGRLDEAIRNFSRALRLDPGYAEVHNNLGIALARKGQLEDAEGHFKEALRLRPDFAGARNNVTKILALRKK
jgi:spermidine synthase